MQQGAEVRWIVLGLDGGHVTLGRHREPTEDEIRHAEAAQLFVPVLFTIGAAGQPAQPARFLLNQTLRREGDGAWRVASILPIPQPRS